jgi:cytochrome c oxidase accessory protein FixG
VDCGICVQVCPTGIDIRNGLQYECIGCAACIDGCDQVMQKVGRPQKLIRYSTTHAMEGRATRVLRPRVLVYGFILLAITAAAAASLYLRVPLKVDVIRDRAAIAREVEGGLIENVYRLQIMNTTEQARAFEISVSGLPGIQVWGEPTIGVPAATSRMIPVKVRAEPARVGTHPIEFHVRALGTQGVAVREESVFIVR